MYIHMYIHTLYMCTLAKVHTPSVEYCVKCTNLTLCTCIHLQRNSALLLCVYICMYMYVCTYPPYTHTYTTFPHILQLFLSTGVIKSGRLLFTRKLTAPSIPAPGKSYGYDERGDGSLTPQPLPPQDSTMGPAFYNVSHVCIYIMYMYGDPHITHTHCIVSCVFTLALYVCKYTHHRDFLSEKCIHNAHDNCIDAYYVNHELPQDETGTSVKYKGVHFGNLQSLRTQFRGA